MSAVRRLERLRGRHPGFFSDWRIYKYTGDFTGIATSGTGAESATRNKSLLARGDDVRPTRGRRNFMNALRYGNTPRPTPKISAMRKVDEADTLRVEMRWSVLTTKALIAFSATKGLWRRGVCLELDYRRTITVSHGGETQEAQEGGLSLAHLLVVAALAFTPTL